jgi:DNA-binding MarR family transcriptional regulator
MAMGARRPDDKQSVAADAWRMMADYAFTKFQGSEHVVMLRELGLTPGHLKALAVLDPNEPRPMRALADALACDASMVTWLVDRLEERGLVERRTSPSDRRVKTLMLTPYGIRTRARLSEALYKPPADLLELDRRSLELLRDQLRKLPVNGRSFWTGSPSAQDRTPTVAEG